MRIDAHGNLTVYAIRHALYGIERFAHSHHHHAHQPACRVHQPYPCDRYEPAAHARPIHISQHPEPIIARPCPDQADPHADTQTTTLTALPGGLPNIVTKWITVPANLAPASAPGALQGFYYGQPVPNVGNLLDVVA